MSFFNGHYDTWCYLPVMGFVSFNDEREQYLCAAVLRPGNVTAAVGAVGILRRLIGLIRLLEPPARLMYRSLLQQGWHWELPPYLPANDEQLMKLADAPTHEDWGRHRGPVLAMFLD